MSYQQALNFIPVFVLVFFRLAGLMIYAPLLGSSRIPKRVKAMLGLVLAFGFVAAVPAPPVLPATPWELAIAIGGEMMIGLVVGMIVSFVFIAAQWAGEMVGQQMGINIAQQFDPAFGQSSTIIADLYFMLTLVVFLLINGHHAMLHALRASFDTMPLLSAGMTKSLLDTVIDLFSTATMLAFQLASPVLITMVVVDLALGALSKTMPQLNVMTAGMSMRSLIGLAVLWCGVSLTMGVIGDALHVSLENSESVWQNQPAQSVGGN